MEIRRAGPDVLVTDYAWGSLDIERAVLAEAGASLIVAESGTEAELARLAVDADAILTNWARVSAAVLDAATRCLTVGRYGVGVDNIDVARATELGIIVSNVPTYCTDEVADHALMMMIALARRLPELAGGIRSGRWDSALPGGFRRLRGRVLGLVGLGAIGRAFAARARVLGLEVIAYRRSGAGGPGVPGVEIVDGLDELLLRADVVSLHVPLTPATRGLIGETELRAMKPTAYLINTARGPLVDTAALVGALAAGRLAGAGLDVTDPEPLPPDHPLRGRDNVIITPHTAFSSDGSLADLALAAATNVADVLTGRRLPATIINPEVLAAPTLRARIPSWSE